MWPDRHLLILCPHCRGVLWNNEQEQVGEIQPWATPGQRDAFKDAQYFEIPSAEDYLVALGEIDLDRGKERYLRLRAWRAGNDDRRHGDATLPLSVAETANLLDLVELLDESDQNDWLLKAEAFRELGRFEDALALLSQKFNRELSQMVTTIKKLALLHDPFVKEIFTGRQGLLGATIFIANPDGPPW